jgi:hypothetical protein
MSQASLGKNKEQKGLECGSSNKCLPSKHKALNSSTAKKKEEKEIS